MLPLRVRIRRSLSDPILQAALDANAERRLQGRERAFASLPDAEERRRRAQRVRAEVVDHLESYLERFLEQVVAHGIHVHRARDAAEACQITLDLLAEYAARRGRESLWIAKSKSMVSEEIELNHALGAAGHQVVETDLGEYIVQLRGERPSHIITPAVHLRRQEVGQLFHEKLGIPYTEAITTLTQTARQTLRRVFLQADVGISGVNFGVVENGSLCIVTNEGNGRMVTTLPRLHIALMGMERLVPTLDDLALMLSLLPRSATGQKLTVYTQLLHAPLEGQERHLIVLDNGRRAVQQSPLHASLHCIRCGACLNACPAFREMGGHAYGSVYPGPIGSVLSPALFGAEFTALAYACSLCGACEEVCPVKIPLPDLLIGVRSGELPQPQAQGKAIPFATRLGLRLYTWLATHPWAFQLAQAWLAAALGGTGGQRVPQWTGWGQGRLLPRPARASFHALWRHPGAGESIQRNTAVDSAAVAPGPLSESARQVAPAGTQDPGAAIAPRPAGGVDRFIQEWQSLGGEIVPVKGELTQALLEWLRAEGIQRLYLAEKVDGVDADTLCRAGVQIGVEANSPAGLSGVLAAVAETGSLVLTAQTQAQAGASLLPGIHLAVVRKEQILPTLEMALRLAIEPRGATTVLISGPSRTADIEMTLTIGVHGPGRTVVFLCE